MKNTAIHILLKTNLQWAKDEEHRVNTEKYEYEYDWIWRLFIKLHNKNTKTP